MFHKLTSLLFLLTIFGIQTQLFDWNCIEKYCEPVLENSKICKIVKLCSCVQHVNSCINFYNQNPEIQDELFVITKMGNTIKMGQVRNSDTRNKTLIKFYINLFSTEDPTGKLSVSGLCSPEEQFILFGNYSSNDSMDLEQLNLTGIQVNTHVSEIDLTQNCISEIFGSFSEAFPHLRLLNLGTNKMKHLSKKTLKGLTFLSFLNFRNNLLNRIDDEAFKDLRILDTLSLAFNELTVLSPTLFSNTLHLRKLVLNGNNFKTLQENVFQFLGNLQYLWLEANRLEELPSKIFEKQNKLVVLILSSNNLKFIDENWFLGLHNLEVLEFNNNSMVIPPTKTSFQHLKKLIGLSLSNNLLQEIPELILLPSNEFILIDISNNSITTMNLPIRNQLTKCKVLDLSNNCFKNVSVSTPKYPNTKATTYEQLMCTNCCLTKINHKMLEDVSQIADLKHNSITALTEKDFNAIPDGITIDLSHNKISKVTINTTEFSLKNRQLKMKSVSVVLDFNPFKCDCSVLPFIQSIKREHGEYWIRFPTTKVNISMNNLFCEAPTLVKNRKVISLKNEELLCDIDHKDGCPHKCKCDSRPFDNTVIIDCSGQMLEKFPAFDKRLFKHSIILNLENNSIETIPELDDDFWFAITQLHLSQNQFKNADNLKLGRNLTALSIDNNRIQKIETLFFILASNLNVTIKMAENPWSCDCGFVRQLIYSKNVLDISDLKCYYEDESEIKHAFVTELSDQEICPLPISLGNLDIMKIAIPVALILVILIATSFILFRRYQSQINLWLFAHGICLKQVSEDDIDVDKIFDAFVSYSSKDEDWAIEVLVKGLEQGTPAYKLCLQERDWIGGERIPDQIVRSVEQSRRTIFVLTKNFVESYWSLIEFYAAYRNTVKDNRNRLIVVVPDEVPEINTTNEELKKFISMNTYLKCDQPNFWNKLRCALPRVRHQPDIVQLNEVNNIV